MQNNGESWANSCMKSGKIRLYIHIYKYLPKKCLKVYKETNKDG